MIIILGDGILGRELSKQTGWAIASRKLGNLDIDNYNSLLDLLHNYDTVVNCIANTDSYSKDREAHWDVNYRFAADLSDLCNTEGKKLVHISTEFVYANNPTPPTEDDIPIPDNTWYAYTKLLADEYIKLTNNNYLVCRELHKPNDFNYPEVWDVMTSGDKVGKIASIIVQLILQDDIGVFNVGTGDKNLKELNPSAKLVQAPAHVPKDTRMNLDKLKLALNG